MTQRRRFWDRFLHRRSVALEPALARSMLVPFAVMGLVVAGVGAFLLRDVAVVAGVYVVVVVAVTGRALASLRHGRLDSWSLRWTRRTDVES